MDAAKYITIAVLVGMLARSLDVHSHSPRREARLRD